VGNPGPREEIHALAAEGATLSDFLRGISVEDWKSPTRCPMFDVRDLVIHMTTMMQRMGETCGEHFPGAEAQNDRFGWWDYDIEEDQKETAVWIAEARTQFPDGPILDEWREALDAGVAAVVESTEHGDPIVRPHEKFIHLSDYVATRVLEITIHTMDVRNAFGLGPDPTPNGMVVTLEILAGLLGADPRALGFDDADFADLSTGRRPLTGDDKERLGPLADRLPLLG
jgi:uncharacterized protein (TIGR03083 family)